MKILAIRGENLASLASFDLDFERGPLGQAGLFAITGPTGAGKTTLLDALCVALFDRTPRLSARGGVPVGRADEEEKDRLAANDVRALLRRGAGEGFAEVDFAGRDDRVYRARWSVWRARRKAAGRLQGQEVALVDVASGRALGGTKTETLAAIEERLGLSFEQFRRSALLAQNDFAAFLQADYRERSELLERMTGTRLYTDVSIAAHRRAQEEVAARQALEARIEAHAILADDEREALEGERRQRASLRDAARLRQQEVAAMLEHHREARAAAEAETLAQRELEEAERVLAATGALRAEVEAVRAARERRGVVDACDRAAAAVRAATEERELRGGRARQADGALDEATARVEAAERALERARVAYAERLRGRQRELGRAAERARDWLSAHAEVAAAAASFLDDGHDDVDPAASAAELDERRGALDDALAARDRDRRAAEAQRREAREALAAAAARAEAARAAADAADLKAVRGRRDAAIEHREQLRALHDAARAGLAARRAATEAAAEVSAAEGEAAAAEREAEQAAADGALVTARHEEAERARDSARLAVDLAAHRAGLVDGEPCPLCGAAEHPYAAEATPLDALLAGEEARVRALRSELEALQCRRAEAAAAVAQAGRRRAEAAARVAQAERALDDARAAWRAAVATLGELGLLEDPAVDGTADAVAQRLEGVERHLAELGEAVREAEKLERAAVEARALVDARRSDSEQAALRAEEAERAHQAARAALARCDAARVRLRRDAIAEAERELAEVAARLEAADTARLPEERAVADATEAARAAEGARLVARERLAAQETAVEEARAAHARCRAALDAALAEMADGAGADPGGAGAAVVDGPDLAAAEAALRARLARGEDWLRERTERLRAASERVAAASGSVDACRRRVAEIAAAGPPALGEPAAAEEAARLAARLDELGDELADVTARLRQDDAARAQRRALGDEIAALQRRAHLYQSLSELIGSADGKKFRVFAQSLTLEALLAGANAHLAELAPRYLVQRVPGHDLDLQIIDRDVGDEVRSVNSLSGGESFLVSLALALALSSLSARDVLVRSLLVDEGFGTLDPATLDTALSVLDALQASGRKVGLISHVPGLAERIGTRVQVVPRGGGVSDVRVAGPGF